MTLAKRIVALTIEYRTLQRSLLVGREQRAIFVRTSSKGIKTVDYTIVIIRNWLGNPVNFKGTNEDQNIYVGASCCQLIILFCLHVFQNEIVFRFRNDVARLFLL